MPESLKYTVLLLAGDRPGDELAQTYGRKALVPLCGKPMVTYTLETLLGAPIVGPIIIVANDIAGIRDNAEVQAIVAHANGRISFREGGRGPAASVFKVIEEAAIADTVLVVTADNPLLSQASLKTFCAHSVEAKADVTVGMIVESDFISVFPGVKRTFVRLKGEGYKGCNLFTLRAGQGPKAAAVWREVEHQRKRPWQLLAHFGPGVLIRALMGRLGIDDALAAVSRSMDLEVRAVMLRDPRAAMDVDRPSHIPVVERVLAQGGA